MAIPSLDLRWHEAGTESWGTPLTQRRLPVAPADPYFEQMRNFAAVIRGTEPPLLSGRDATMTLASTLAIAMSAQTGGAVRVDDLMAVGARPKPKQGSRGKKAKT